MKTSLAFSRFKKPFAPALILSAVLLFSTSGTAWAHVAVDATSKEGGEQSILTFQVPTESDTANTTGLRVQLPKDSPFTSVRVEETPGWEAELHRAPLPEPVDNGHGGEITEAVTEIVWTATGEGIGSDEYGALKASVYPLPSSGTLFFPAVQSYSDGREVDWVQQVEGDAQTERPAPSLRVGNQELASDVQAAATVEAAPEEGNSQLSLWLSLLALTLGVFGSIAGGWALVRGRR